MSFSCLLRLKEKEKVMIVNPLMTVGGKDDDRISQSGAGIQTMPLSLYGHLRVVMNFFVVHPK